MDINNKIIESHEESIRYCNDRIKNYKLRIKHHEDVIKDLQHDRKELIKYW